MNISLVPRRNERLHDAYCNNFVVKLPLAGKLLEWEVVFNEDDYEFAPDFFFQDEYFLADPTADVLLKNVPSLLEWNLHNSKSFKLVVCEFLNLYKRFQVSKSCNLYYYCFIALLVIFEYRSPRLNFLTHVFPSVLLNRCRVARYHTYR